MHELQFLKAAFTRSVYDATNAEWNYCIVDKKIEGCENTEPIDPDADHDNAKKCCRSKETDPLDFIKYSDADWNNDGKVSVADLGPLKRNFGLDCGPRAKKDIRLGVSDKTKTGMERVDFNGDGVVNFDDFVLMDSKGKPRCGFLQVTKSTCLVCDDDDGTPNIDYCY